MGPKPKDETGSTYGRLKILRRVESKSGWWVCKCICGKIIEAYGPDLRRLHTTSCGCARLDATVTHGMRNTVEYKTWVMLKQRCTNPNSDSYIHYGLRGVKVCRRWENSFENFFADMGKRPAGCSLDRRDTNGNYTKKNCRWASRLEQENNKRNNRTISVDGSRMTIAEAARHFKINYQTLYHRIVYKKWSVEKSISKVI